MGALLRHLASEPDCTEFSELKFERYQYRNPAAYDLMPYSGLRQVLRLVAERAWEQDGTPSKLSATATTKTAAAAAAAAAAATTEQLRRAKLTSASV